MVFPGPDVKLWVRLNCYLNIFCIISPEFGTIFGMEFPASSGSVNENEKKWMHY